MGKKSTLSREALENICKADRKVIKSLRADLERSQTITESIRVELGERDYNFRQLAQTHKAELRELNDDHKKQISHHNSVVHALQQQVLRAEKDTARLEGYIDRVKDEDPRTTTAAPEDKSAPPLARRQYFTVDKKTNWPAD